MLTIILLDFQYYFLIKVIAVQERININGKFSQGILLSIIFKEYYKKYGLSNTINCSRESEINNMGIVETKNGFCFKVKIEGRENPISN